MQNRMEKCALYMETIHLKFMFAKYDLFKHIKKYFKGKI